jgi:GTP-binding protein YchF
LKQLSLIFDFEFYMSLKVGIVGLPNVGKSTLFKALTRKSVDISNYPFCTIEPNVGIVEVPDARLSQLAALSHSRKIIPAVIEFVDIAGLVKGASEGEGLGNKFLSNIREVDAIVEVVRVFENSNITHVYNRVAPTEDIEIINAELILSDLETLAKRKLKTAKDARAGIKDAIVEMAVLENLEKVLQAGNLAYDVMQNFGDDEKKIARGLQLLTAKPFLYVYNMTDMDASLSVGLESRPHVKLDIKIEEELISMPPEEAAELGFQSHLGGLAQRAYTLLNLITYFTTGEDETRAWTIPNDSTAQEAGAAIHTDFQEKFIRAEIIYWEKLLEAGSWSSARDKGLFRLEGKEYIVQDGDVIVFKI